MTTETDYPILRHIEKLTESEENLYLKGDLSENEIAELQTIRGELDQYWDLLRQRRALREAGKDPDDAQIRPLDQIKNYQE